MVTLSNLTRLVKKRKRVGRGGDRGGTSGKGHKGQKARSGPTLGVIFEGGQMPLTRRLPKRGFSNAPFKEVYDIVNVSRLSALFEGGETVNRESLIDKGVVKKSSRLPIKVLAQGALDKKLIVYADKFSKAAEEAIRNSGGEAHVNKER
jgi:large subunit ribosomal protein L15